MVGPYTQPRPAHVNQKPRGLPHTKIEGRLAGSVGLVHFDSSNRMNAKVKKKISKFQSQINHTNKLTRLKSQIYFIQISQIFELIITFNLFWNEYIFYRYFEKIDYLSNVSLINVYSINIKCTKGFPMPQCYPSARGRQFADDVAMRLDRESRENSIEESIKVVKICNLPLLWRARTFFFNKGAQESLYRDSHL